MCGYGRLHCQGGAVNTALPFNIHIIIVHSAGIYPMGHLYHLYAGHFAEAVDQHSKNEAIDTAWELLFARGRAVWGHSPFQY